MARKHRPTAVSLDVFLPDMLGWTVLNQLKRSPETRHIPVQILTIEDERQYGLERGAFSFVTKTVTTDRLEQAIDRLKDFTTSRTRRLLIVEDDPAEQMSVTELLGANDVKIDSAGSGAAALELMR
jgi:CheY-like chemotaxis protein